MRVTSNVVLVTEGCRDRQFDLRTGSAFAPDLEMTSDTLGPLTHTPEAPMSGPPIRTKQNRIDADPVIPHPYTKLLCLIPDLDFDPPCLCVAERIAQGFTCNAVDFIP